MPRFRSIGDAVGARHAAKPFLWACVAAALSLVAVFLLGKLAGHPPGMSALYFLPVWVATRLSGMRAGMLFVVLISSLLAVLDIQLGFVSKSQILGNALLRAGSLTLMMFLIRQAEHSLRKAQKLALHDPLTGVLNRLALNQLGLFAIERARAHRKPLVLAMIDCDRFKELNDRFGHAYGDQVLKHLARVVQAGIRPDGIVARAGGDEFVVILQDMGLAKATEVMERVYESFSKAMLTLGCDASITYGLALLGPDGNTVASLAHAADRDMYRRKSMRRALVHAYSHEGLHAET